MPTILIDGNAKAILDETKVELKAMGYGSPDFSDAIRELKTGSGKNGQRA